MDAEKDFAGKRQEDVVLLIPAEESTTSATETATPETSANHSVIKQLKVESFDHVCKKTNANSKPESPGHQVDDHSPEFAKSGSPHKPPRPAQRESLLRRRSFSKPKSRFVEQPVPPAVPVAASEAEIRTASSRHGSPNPRASGTPKTPSFAGDDGDEAGEDEEEEEEEEIYRKQQLPEVGKRRRNWKVRILLEWAILVLAIGCLISSLTVRKMQGIVIWGLEIWKWCLMVAVIFCGRLVTHWLVTLLVFLIEMNFLLRKKVLYFVYGLKNSVQVCIWLSLVLLSWSLLFRHGVRRSRTTARVLDYISRALASLLVGSMLWLVKTLLVKILASSFHMNTFFDRIHESIFHQYLLQTLSGRPAMEMAEKLGDAKSNAQVSFRGMGKGKGKGKEQKQGVIDVSKLQKLRQEKVSALTMKGLINVIRSSGLSTISNTIESFDEEGGEQRDQEITNEYEAKAAAYRIFKNVAKPGYKYIDGGDLLKFLSKEEVELVLPLFEGAAESGKIKKSALKNWVVIFQTVALGELSLCCYIFLF